MSRVRMLVALATIVCAALAPRAFARAAAPTPSPAVCEAVSIAEISDILGFAVGPADETSRSGGICFFATRAVSDEGSVSYAIVTPADLPERRAFFAVLARRCAGVSDVAPRAAVCATYAKLAVAADLDAYLSARTSGAGSTPVPNLGDAAFATPDALYVRRGRRIVEASVTRDGTFALVPSTALASLLLSR